MPVQGAVVYLDGNWVDVVSVLTGALYALFKRWQKQLHWRSKSVANYFATGVGLFPLVLLMAGVASQWALHELVTASRATLTIAGLYAILAMLDD